MQTEIAVQRREEELAAISAMQQTAATATATAQTAAAETAQAQAKAQNPYVDVQVGDIIEFGSTCATLSAATAPCPCRHKAKRPWRSGSSSPSTA